METKELIRLIKENPDLVALPNEYMNNILDVSSYTYEQIFNMLRELSPLGDQVEAVKSKAYDNPEVAKAFLMGQLQAIIQMCEYEIGRKHDKSYINYVKSNPGLMDVIMAIGENGFMTGSDIARASDNSRQNINNIFHRTEGIQNYIRRETLDENKKKVFYSLTREGLTVYNHLKQCSKEELDSIKENALEKRGVQIDWYINEEIGSNRPIRNEQPIGVRVSSMPSVYAHKAHPSMHRLKGGRQNAFSYVVEKRKVAYKKAPKGKELVKVK